MKTLVMLSAIPASGKSTWAKWFKENNRNVVILNSDDIRMEITNGDYQVMMLQLLLMLMIYM